MDSVPVLKPREVARLLERLGFVERPTARFSPAVQARGWPRNDDPIPSGPWHISYVAPLLRKIARDVGLTVEELLGREWRAVQQRASAAVLRAPLTAIVRHSDGRVMVEPDAPRPYTGELDSQQAAAAMQAARLNAVELLDTADILFGLKRFQHSLAFSILAIEETGKLAILQGILLGLGGTPEQLWRRYRQHRAKTEMLNVGIWARIRATFPEIEAERAQQIAAQGPTPDELEVSKQRAIYSDCLEDRGSFVCHLPRNADWRQAAWERLCEARAIAMAPRDRPREELEVWIRHVRAAHASGKPLAAVLPDLHKDLVARGFHKEGFWETLLQDLERNSQDV